MIYYSILVNNVDHSIHKEEKDFREIKICMSRELPDVETIHFTFF